MIDNTGLRSNIHNKILLPFKAIIFDMDGTLLESTEADYKAWERVFNYYGKELTYHQYVPLLGIRSADVIRKVLGFADEEDVARILMEKYNQFVDYVNQNPVQAVPSTTEFLDHLSQYDISVGLATSSRHLKTDLLLDKLDLRKYFNAIVTGEQVTNSKPAPDIFLKAADRLQVKPEECVVVEDGPIGVSAAKSAGMKCIAITTTHPAEKLQHADWIIHTYEGANLEQIVNGKY